MLYICSSTRCDPSWGAQAADGLGSMRHADCRSARAAHVVGGCSCCCWLPARFLLLLLAACSLLASRCTRGGLVQLDPLGAKNRANSQVAGLGQCGLLHLCGASAQDLDLRSCVRLISAGSGASLSALSSPASASLRSVVAAVGFAACTGSCAARTGHS